MNYKVLNTIQCVLLGIVLALNISTIAIMSTKMYFETVYIISPFSCGFLIAMEIAKYNFKKNIFNEIFLSLILLFFSTLACIIILALQTKATQIVFIVFQSITILCGPVYIIIMKVYTNYKQNITPLKDKEIPLINNHNSSSLSSGISL